MAFRAEFRLGGVSACTIRYEFAHRPEGRGPSLFWQTSVTTAGGTSAVSSGAGFRDQAHVHVAPAVDTRSGAPVGEVHRVEGKDEFTGWDGVLAVTLLAKNVTRHPDLSDSIAFAIDCDKAFRPERTLGGTELLLFEPEASTGGAGLNVGSDSVNIDDRVRATLTGENSSVYISAPGSMTGTLHIRGGRLDMAYPFVEQSALKFLEGGPGAYEASFRLTKRGPFTGALVGFSEAASLDEASRSRPVLLSST